ncbi:GNAT family N-acetyltransferase, partial [Aliarcobacter butzleri]
SYIYIYSYETNNHIVGLLLAYNSNDVEKLDSPMIEHFKRKNIFLDSFVKECFEDEFYIDTVSVNTSLLGKEIAKVLFSID